MVETHGHTGDDGTTSLADGTRVEKSSPYIKALGLTDELTSLIGIVIASAIDHDVRRVLVSVQDVLADLGGELEYPGKVLITHINLACLERELDKYSDQLPEIDQVVLPRGVMAAALCFHAWAACRTLERELVELTATDQRGCIESRRIPYVNRLSDLLRVLSCVINLRAGEEITFAKGGPLPGTS